MEPVSSDDLRQAMSAAVAGAGARGADREVAAPAFLLQISQAALATVQEARSAEDRAQSLALFIEVSGVANGSFTYDMWFEALGDAGGADVVEQHGDLAIVITGGSVDRLRGATLDVGDEGLVLLNPNTPPPDPAPTAPGDYGDLTSPLAVAVLEVLEQEVNPQIAMHGGHADLMGVDDRQIAYLRLSGGCQGCGLAQVTLSQGIAVAIKESVPEIADVVDVTAHAAGTNPYYASSKK